MADCRSRPWIVTRGQWKLAGGLVALALAMLWFSTASNDLRAGLRRLIGEDGCVCRDCVSHTFVLFPPIDSGGCIRTNETDPSFFAFGAAFAAIALPTFVRWCVWRRPRSIHECAKCGYGLRGLPSNICPECGTAQHV